VQSGLQLRSRDGDAGLDQMLEVQTPLSYNFAPGEIGSFSFTATPTYISSVTFNNDEVQLRRFGRNAVSNTGAVASPGDINDSGIALSAGFNAGWIQAELGVTPLGFLFTNPVGGITSRPKLSEAVTLRFTIEQRAVMDSVHSYAGFTDTRNGVTFGGVVKRGGSLGIEVDTGDFGAYANAGFYQFEGQRVEDNRSIEGNMDAYIRIIERPDEELKIGGNVSFFGYEENLRHFTLGHGGYFSPQSYF
jgi:cellulose synthase operon protein C